MREDGGGKRERDFLKKILFSERACCGAGGVQKEKERETLKLTSC